MSTVLLALPIVRHFKTRFHRCPLTATTSVTTTMTPTLTHECKSSTVFCLDQPATPHMYPQAAIGCIILEVVHTRRGNWKDAKATATMIHTAIPASNALSATQMNRCPDVRKAVTATLVVKTTATAMQVRSAMGCFHLGFWVTVFCEYVVARTSHQSASYSLQHPLPPLTNQLSISYTCRHPTRAYSEDDFPRSHLITHVLFMPAHLTPPFL